MHGDSVINEGTVITKGAVIEHAAVFAGKGNTLGHTLIHNVVAYLHRAGREYLDIPRFR